MPPEPDLSRIRLTRHAEQRIGQRRMSPGALAVGLAHGRRLPGRGAQVRAIGRREVEHHRALGLDLRPFEGPQVVLDAEGAEGLYRRPPRFPRPPVRLVREPAMPTFWNLSNPPAEASWSVAQREAAHAVAALLEEGGRPGDPVAVMGVFSLVAALAPCLLPPAQGWRGRALLRL